MRRTRSPLRRFAAVALGKLHLLRPVVRLRERVVAARAPAVAPGLVDGPPLPPARLRVLVDGHGDPERFVLAGVVGAEVIRRSLTDAGVALDSVGSLLDFGCGCGRVARQWSDLRGPEIHGCDYNRDLVRWCDENLDFMRTRQSSLLPPAPYPDDRFDAIYAISVFTHLTEPVQRAWVSEFLRILKPGGLLLFTTHGDRYRDGLSAAELAAYDRGELVVQRPRLQGANSCGAFHPPGWVQERLLHGFSVPVFTPGAQAHPAFEQDTYVAKAQTWPDDPAEH